MNPNIFREYDIRGIVGRDLTPDVALLVGKAWGTYLARRGASTVAVGGDLRLSSPEYAAAVAEGASSCGLEVVHVGTGIPTPQLYFAIAHLSADGGLMVTGSHNPIEYNGFKMCEGLAALWGPQIQELRGLIERGEFETGKGSVREEDVTEAYFEALRSRAKLARPLKVVVDAGNGCASTLGPRLLRAIGCEVVPLFCEPDGRFPNHLPDPTVPEYMEELSRRVVAEGADAGIGYDGDADRVGAVDERGRIIFADKILALLARDVLSRRPVPIVFDVKCSEGLAEDILAHGGTPVMSKTGHSLIKNKMKEVGAPLAGEMSGHIFFAEDYYGFDDALLASAKFLQVLAASGRKASELVATIPHYEATPEIRVTCPDEEKFKVVERIRDQMRREPGVVEVIDIDGVRAKFGDGWGLLRASNTQPVLVMRFEGRSQEAMRRIREIFLAKLRAFPCVEGLPQD